MKVFQYFSTLLALAFLMFNQTVLAHGEDDPLINKVMIDQLERRSGDDLESQILEGSLWIGKDLNKFWLKIDAERMHGDVEELETQLLYSRAFSPYWDIQLGFMKDLKNENGDTWGVIGFLGLAPYSFEVDAALFFNERGQVRYNIKTEYEILFTQKLILAPEINLNVYHKTDTLQRHGSGLSDAQLSLRLRYEVTREFAPYVGINKNRVFGNTATFARQDNEVVSNLEWVVGFRAWF